MTNKDSDDLELFRKQFGDIRRIKSDRVEHNHKPAAAKRRRNTQFDENKLDAFGNALDKQETESDDIFTYRGQGIQNKLFRKLQRGQLPIEARLDLHGQTRSKALNKLQGFIASSQHRGLRHLLIIHGKGFQSEDGQPVLKPAVASWLRKIQAVMAFCPAQASDGGDGALYVLLKKR